MKTRRSPKRPFLRLMSSWRALWPLKPRGGGRILLYHAVGTPLSIDTYGLSLAPDLFARHIKVLCAQPHLRCVPFEAIADSPCAVDSSVTTVAVTFDDGYADNLLVAAPILARHGVPFTVFVTRDHVRSGARQYLTPAQVRELAAVPGAAIGAHGATHRRLTTCDDRALREELHASRAFLEELLQQPVRDIAYPHGDVDERVRAAAARAGFLRGGCSVFGLNEPERDPLLLRRCEIWADDSPRIFQQKLRGDWDWHGRLQPDPASRNRLP